MRAFGTLMAILALRLADFLPTSGGLKATSAFPKADCVLRVSVSHDDDELACAQMHPM